eukprot:TRINITY_DN3121_c0_g1_i7.p1 TRINITY_DN3121_c0_g1~~TRINITY_DN3121_c0_g1_i7.p1  ORF type:complete len:366 (+),score=69.97 TRINITY_DN3121_c0_g1_i7:260-1357(+)
MFQKEDQELVRFLPFVCVLGLATLMSVFPVIVVNSHDLFCQESPSCQDVLPELAFAFDNMLFTVPIIGIPIIAVVALSFVGFQSPSVRRLTAYHALQFLAFTMCSMAPMISFLAKEGRDDRYDGLGALKYVLRAAMAMVSGLGIALVCASLANQVKQNKSGEYFRISVESQPTQGFYGMMRHPIFCGVLLIVFANTAFGGEPGFYIAGALAIIVVFFCVLNEDAAKLRSGNDAVVQYVQQTPRMWPTRAGWANYFRGQSIARGIPMPVASSDDDLEMTAALSGQSSAEFDEALAADATVVQGPARTLGLATSVDLEKRQNTLSTLDQVVVALEEDPIRVPATPGTRTPKARSPRSPRSPASGADF